MILLAHNVYFKLNDSSDAAKQKLIDSCKKYLSDHHGTIFFGCGTRALDLNREVNDRDFDVALHVVFDSIASHDAYQEHPKHLQFIQENKPNWAKVRVFDSEVTGVL